MNPVQTSLDIVGGYALPPCLHVVADLGVADVLDETSYIVGDIGGGHRHLLRTILDNVPPATCFSISRASSTRPGTPASERVGCSRATSSRMRCRYVARTGSWKVIDAVGDADALALMRAIRQVLRLRA